jgi:hypothetical protein
MTTKKIWPVVFPTFQYNEDVSALARKNDLEIVDAKFCKNADPSMIESNPPKLTKKSAKKMQEQANEESNQIPEIGSGSDQ